MNSFRAALILALTLAGTHHALAAQQQRNVILFVPDGLRSGRQGNDGQVLEYLVADIIRVGSIFENESYL